MKNALNEEVTTFLNNLNHPLINEINELRKIILQTKITLQENIKWNGPNYLYDNEDRVTMRIQPPKQLQLIFHRGAKVKKQPPTRIIIDETGLLLWKENDRAIITFKSIEEIKKSKKNINNLIIQWVDATRNII
ncbi:DUF1801 domain-containing protein [Leptospira ognonensis]|uniref:DUF1801 domain-containing protein n=1 Tax=Leptospira ognonensis TaxID=2484945 RepID=A0A4R9K8W3_9LEPT|nr:DUF1801 domain-containing protein [Leptospira ognonensis]TGL63054.1 DUF1801 domain-containing protein [Leptospira ognonensis]